VSKGQTPIVWKEHLLELWDDCGGSTLEFEYVQRHITKLTPAYESMIDQHATLNQGEEWSIDQAYAKVKKY
jgi:hypothetical protein